MFLLCVALARGDDVVSSTLLRERLLVHKLYGTLREALSVCFIGVYCVQCEYCRSLFCTRDVVICERM